MDLLNREIKWLDEDLDRVGVCICMINICTIVIYQALEFKNLVVSAQQYNTEFNCVYSS